MDVHEIYVCSRHNIHIWKLCQQIDIFVSFSDLRVFQILLLISSDPLRFKNIQIISKIVDHVYSQEDFGVQLPSHLLYDLAEAKYFIVAVLFDLDIFNYFSGARIHDILSNGDFHGADSWAHGGGVELVVEVRPVEAGLVWVADAVGSDGGAPNQVLAQGDFLDEVVSQPLLRAFLVRFGPQGGIRVVLIHFGVVILEHPRVLRHLKKSSFVVHEGGVNFFLVFRMNGSVGEKHHVDRAVELVLLVVDGEALFAILHI